MAIDVTTRMAAPDDFEQWLPLWLGYNAFYERVGPTAPTDKLIENTWKRFFIEDAPVYALVAESDDRLVGLAHYLFHLNTSMVEPVCYMQDLFTDGAKRGSGVGRALIDHVYDKARDYGSSQVYWHTHETNQTAMKLYDKMADHSGFVVYEHEV